MRTLLPALLASGSVLLAVRGIALVRERGPLARFEASLPRREAAWSPGPVSRLLENLGTRLGPALLARLGESHRGRISSRLDLAGRPGGMDVARYADRKAAFGASGVGLGATLAALSGSVWLLVVLPVAGWFGLDVWIARQGRLRQERLERDLPDFLDILGVTVRAGLGYRAALSRVADAIGGPIGEEVRAALREMDLGRSRREALEALRDRNESPTLEQFVTAQLQAEELGAPLADAITDIATDMRRETAQAARRRAHRAAPRVSLIVTSVIVPGAMLLIGVGFFLATDAGIGQLL
jgi:tight adherence protein C